MIETRTSSPAPTTPGAAPSAPVSAPPGQAGSQPLLRVASVGQSQEDASKAGDDQTVSIQFQMAP